jgi:HSP20 family protein
MAINNLLTKFRGRNEVPVRRTEWEPMSGFQSEMNRLFDDFFSDFSLTPRWNAPARQMAVFSPGVDLAETDDDVIVTAELPGMDKGDVSVEMDGNTLVISGEKKEDREDKNRNWHFREQSYGSFRREIPLPAAVMDDKAKASFRKGVLSVTIPKKEEAKTKRKTIDIATD